MANKPTPKNLKLLRGTHRKDRDGDKNLIPDFDNSKPECPRQIKGEARKEWNRVVNILGDAGIINQLDKSVLAQYCVLWSQFMDSIASPDCEPFLAAQHTQLRLCAAELGITAVSRGKVLKDGEAKKNKFAK